VPYHFKSSLGFLISGIQPHQVRHIICSASFQTWGGGNANGSRAG
jgi:hypothetical protein